MDARRAETTAHAGGLVHDSRLRKGTPKLLNKSISNPPQGFVPL
jgi:hypothetical protein